MTTTRRKPRISDIVWTPAMAALLGTDTDDAIAQRLGLSPWNVRRQRELLGRPSVNARPPAMR